MLHFETRYGTVLADEEDLDLFTTKRGKSKRICVVQKRNQKPYAVRGGRPVRRTILERKLARGEVTDHINRNTLDGRRNNLRPATPQQNSQNRSVQKNYRLGHKGVHFVINSGRPVYQAQIKMEGKLKTIVTAQASSRGMRG